MRTLRRLRSASVLAGLAASLLAGACAPAADGDAEPCAGDATPAIERPAIDLGRSDVSRHNLRAWVELLADGRLEGRHAGTRGARDAAALLAAEMAHLGLEPADPEGGFCRGFPFMGDRDFNVVGHLPAADGRAAVLVGAHYDGQGVHPLGRIYPGADDNASGVAALLEVARLAGRRPEAPRPGWIFVAFGAEEVGRMGSRAYLSDPRAPPPGIELAVNLDMVGRPLDGELGGAIGFLAYGASPPATRSRLVAAAAAAGVEIRPLDDAGDLKPALTDAQVLAARWPTLLLSTALHEDHHRLSDTPERIDGAQIERAARLVLALGDILAEP